MIHKKDFVMIDDRISMSKLTLMKSQIYYRIKMDKEFFRPETISTVL